MNNWKAVGRDIEEVAKGAWDGFKSQASANIDQYTKSLIAGDKNVSILKSNLPYIRLNDARVKNKSSVLAEFGEKEDTEKTYYTSDGESGSIEDRPMLINPYNDKRKLERQNIKLNKDLFESNTDKVYTENENGESTTTTSVTGVGIGRSNVNGIEDTNGLIGKTKKWFQSAKDDAIGSNFNTLISRFHTDTEESKDTTNEIQSAVSQKYGMSHGRNLLKVGEPSKETGYEDPYCRTWTAFKSYWTYKDCIRPLNDEGSAATQTRLEGEYKWNAFRTHSYSIDNETAFESGGKRLESYGTMYDNGGEFTGLVNITPKWPSDTEYGATQSNSVSVKKCMFSIENLAWKGQTNTGDNGFETDGLSPEQKGPLGGRIMWFPPYNLRFNESIGAQWNQHEFIGRGEPIYTYSNATRDGSLSFSMLIDHPAILDYWNRKENNTAKYSVDDVDSDEQTLLRFFAGCNVLEAKSNADEPHTGNETTPGNPESNVNNDEKYFQFFVYFPNNYSGQDDMPNGSHPTVNAIEYLLNGVGAQIILNEDGDDADNETIATNMNVTYKIVDKAFGGYEIDNTRNGISGYKDPTDDYVFQTINSSNGKIYKLHKLIGSDNALWSYRVDDDTKEQILSGGATSYIDTTNFGLNGNGYITGVNFWKSKGVVSDTGNVYSFVDVYAALTNDKKALEGIYTNKNVNSIQAITKGERGKISKIQVTGYASSQANNASKTVNTERNKKLAANRAKTVANWIKSALNNVSTETSVVDDYTNYDRTDPSIIEAKRTRCALVTVYYTTNSTTNDTGVESEEEVTIQNSTNSLSNAKGSSDSTTPTSHNKSTATSSVNNDTENGRNSAYGIRYDNEATFFEKLTRNSPHVAKLITDKVKYFSPVFHSMSPEGFNARLTFLQQCMRQGPTANQSMGTNNPNNLAFGRPPVCVLRIGDFYNTKVIVTSLNIDYDPLTFDLNQEGIGVQPMIANITMQFHFIGGSDLAGPINRLQNALSFNYYANTGVYDNRSEEIKYNEQGEPEAFKPFIPLSLSNNYMQQ